MVHGLKMTLREANIADLDRIVALHQKAWAAAYAQDIDPKALASQRRHSREHFENAFSGNSPATVWIAVPAAVSAHNLRDIGSREVGDEHGAYEQDSSPENGSLLGFCECEAKGPHDVRSLELTMLYVDPDVTGSGIGSVLLERAIGDAPAYVWTRPGDSQRFYEQHGFAADGETGTFAGMDVVRLIR